jgi:hypothetical protein
VTQRGRTWSGRVIGALALTALLAGGPPLYSQQQAPDTVHVPGERLTVSLITAGPGSEVWELFGHNAIWIKDQTTGREIVYDYGRFDFAKPGFLSRFVKGQMWYWMGAAYPRDMISAYISRGRSVSVQELDLPPAARAELLRFLEHNVLEENRYYRYDYYRDNCSTRIRDALDQVVGGAISAQSADTVPGSTWRSLSDRLLAADPLAYTGTKLGLGSPTDRPISRWDEMYVPMRLQEYIRTVQIEGPDGELIPLVRSEEVLYQGSGPAERSEPPGWYLIYLAIGSVWGAVMVWCAGVARRGSRLGRVGLGLVAGAWALVAGLGGSLLLFLWFGTDHLMTRANENVLQLNPLALLLLVVVPLALASDRWRKAAIILAGLVAAGSLLGAAAKILPGFDQANWQVIALAVPINVALWVTVRRLLRHSASTASVPAES